MGKKYVFFSKPNLPLEFFAAEIAHDHFIIGQTSSFAKADFSLFRTEIGIPMLLQQLGRLEAARAFYTSETDDQLGVVVVVAMPLKLLFRGRRRQRCL